jgi:hypothetical protein
MYENFELTALTEREAGWEQRFCPTDWCDRDTLYARRDDHNLELWHVTDGQASWLVAATGPVCPHCGGNLLTLSNKMEGVDHPAA